MNEKELERIFKALANKKRLAILRVIKNEKEISVADISDKIKLSFTSTSKHLRILALANILEKDQRSLQVYYSLAPNLPMIVRSAISQLS